GDRHIPAQRWCCRAIARYWSALTMVSSHAQGPFARPKPDEPRGTLKGVPIKVRIGNSDALRDVRLLSICTFAEIMSRENLRRAPPAFANGTHRDRHRRIQSMVAIGSAAMAGGVTGLCH